MATVALYGQVSTFDPETDDWTQYVERLNYYFVANGIDDVTKKRAILLSVVGASTYRLIRNLVAPGKPDEKTYKQLVDLVKEHQCPAPSETVQRFKFNTSSVQDASTKRVCLYLCCRTSLTHRILWISSWRAN